VFDSDYVQQRYAGTIVLDTTPEGVIGVDADLDLDALNARITSGAHVLLQVVTGGRTPRFDLRLGNADATCVDCLGTGDWEWYEATVMPLGQYELDRVEVWAYGESQGTFLTSLYGTPSSGTPTLVAESGFRDSGATWVPAEFTSHPGVNTVTFYASGGATIIPPRPVSGPLFSASTEDLSFLPAFWLTPDQVRLGNSAGVTYELTSSPLMQMGSFILREEDAYAL
jgi:hypothetical protein